MFGWGKRVKARTTIYDYVSTRLFDAGAESMAFEPFTTLPVHRVLGNGDATGQLRMMEQPQIYFNPQTSMNGIGTQTGQFVFGGLSNPAGE